MAERLRFSAREVTMALTLWCAAWLALGLGLLTSGASQPQVAGQPTWAWMAWAAWLEGTGVALALGAVVAGLVQLAGLRWRGLRGRWAAVCGAALAGIVTAGVTLGAVDLLRERPSADMVEWEQRPNRGP
jgi:hypothetical protein